MRATRKCAAGQIWPAGQALRTAAVWYVSMWYVDNRKYIDTELSLGAAI